MDFNERVAEEIVLEAITRESIFRPDRMLEYFICRAQDEVASPIMSTLESGTWKIPLSFLNRMSLKWNQSLRSTNEVLPWVEAVEALGLPNFSFSDYDGSEADEKTPDVIWEQLEGKAMKWPTIVHWEGKEYLIVDAINWTKNEIVQNGEIMHRADIQAMVVCPLKYFDLSR